MIHFADVVDIWRPVVSNEPYGGRDVPGQHICDLPCRLSEREQRGFNSVTGQWVITTDYHLQIGHNADVRVGDQVRNIRRDRGTAVPAILEIVGGGKRRGKLVRMKSFSCKSIGVETVDA